MLQDKRFVISLTTYYLTTTDQVTLTEQQGSTISCFVSNSTNTIMTVNTVLTDTVKCLLAENKSFLTVKFTVNS